MQMVRAIGAAGLLYGLSAPVFAADCPARNTPDQIHVRLDTAQNAFALLDSDAFSFAMEELGLMLPCLDAVPSVPLVAQVHRMVGVQLYADGKGTGARTALKAGKTLEPDYSFPVDLFPEGYALMDDWKVLTAESGPHQRAPVPKQATIFFDGTQTRDRPTDRATFFQHVDRDGKRYTNAYLQPSDALPTYASVPRQRNRILAATAATGIAAAVSYGLAWQTRSAFFEDGSGLKRKELTALRTRSNASFVTAGVFTTLTAGGAIAAVLIGPR